ncbi:hypothetical protein J2S00_003553 [Caldalkalibacillus uzonensis]|uniref:Uncharacterized protein n=1 Tax=Caldalkalibacillus uzonensis TaxID=353224 RepID=A0ABU0CXQ5_9BACI|nr:hypothetical protein [Caldalkalibacillus uzonensis]
MYQSVEPHAGFTTGTPWVAVNPNYTSINVEAALKDLLISNYPVQDQEEITQIELRPYEARVYLLKA